MENVLNEKSFFRYAGKAYFVQEIRGEKVIAYSLVWTGKKVVQCPIEFDKTFVQMVLDNPDKYR